MGKCLDMRERLKKRISSKYIIFNNQEIYCIPIMQKDIKAYC